MSGIACLQLFLNFSLQPYTTHVNTLTTTPIPDLKILFESSSTIKCMRYYLYYIIKL